MLFIQVSEYNLPSLKFFIALFMFLALSILISSLPVFFACAVLSIVTNVDSTSYGLAWIILRVIYLFLYAYKLNPYRTIAWLGSVNCLILMALNLIQ